MVGFAVRYPLLTEMQLALVAVLLPYAENIYSRTYTWACGTWGRLHDRFREVAYQYMLEGNSRKCHGTLH